MNEIMPAISGAALTILTALVALVGAYASRGISALTERIRVETVKMEDDQFRSFADEALDRVDDLAAKTVTQLEQTTAATLRDLVKAGKVDRTELEKLGTRAVQEVMYALNDDYRDAIQKTVGNVEAYVTKAVENKVYELKNVALLPYAIEGVK